MHSPIIPHNLQSQLLFRWRIEYSYSWSLTMEYWYMHSYRTATHQSPKTHRQHPTNNKLFNKSNTLIFIGWWLISMIPNNRIRAWIDIPTKTKQLLLRKLLKLTKSNPIHIQLHLSIYNLVWTILAMYIGLALYAGR